MYVVCTIFRRIAGANKSEVSCFLVHFALCAFANQLNTHHIKVKQYLFVQHWRKQNQQKKRNLSSFLRFIELKRNRRQQHKKKYQQQRQPNFVRKHTRKKGRTTTKNRKSRKSVFIVPHRFTWHEWIKSENIRYLCIYISIWSTNVYVPSIMHTKAKHICLIFLASIKKSLRKVFEYYLCLFVACHIWIWIIWLFFCQLSK